MRLRWTPESADNLESIYLYLTENYPFLAASTMRTLHETALSLLSTPNRGRPGVVSGTRELVLPRMPFIIVYRVMDQTVELLHIYHGAQDRPLH